MLLSIGKICDICFVPDKATKSLVESPRALNLEMSWLRFEVGAGMALLAADWLAVLASLLPSLTFHVGPPSYIDQNQQNVLFNCMCGTKLVINFDMYNLMI